jgi:hypothetical protein
MNEAEGKVEVTDGLDPNRRDRLVAVSKGLAGIVPCIGSAAAEIIGHVIPAQRFDRLVAFVRALDEKVGDIDAEVLDARMRTEEFIDLLEDGLQQAARTLTDERREYIATLLKNSLAADELDHVHDKKLLWLLGELNDAEIIILRSFGLPHGDRRKFVDAHESVVQAPPAYIGASREVLDRAAMHEAFRRRLSELGLIRPRFKKPKRGQLPEFDEKSGMMKASGYDISPLGRMLLRRLELPTDF